MRREFLDESLGELVADVIRALARETSNGRTIANIGLPAMRTYLARSQDTRKAEKALREASKR